MSSAINDETSVPKIIGAAPYTSATGSQVDFQRNPNPNRRSAGPAPTTSCPATVTSRSGRHSARAVRIQRYNGSPRLRRRSRVAGTAACGDGMLAPAVGGGVGVVAEVIAGMVSAGTRPSITDM